MKIVYQRNETNILISMSQCRIIESYQLIKWRKAGVMAWRQRKKNLRKAAYENIQYQQQSCIKRK
jgi:hypothetical protein